MTRDDLIARARAKGFDDAQAAELADAYLAKKAATAPVSTGPKKTPAPKPAAAKKPDPPKPAPAVAARMPDSPRGGGVMLGPVEPPVAQKPKPGATIQNASRPMDTNRPKFDATVTVPEQVTPLGRKVVDQVAGTFYEAGPSRNLRYQPRRSEEPAPAAAPAVAHTFTARDYMGATPAPAKSAPRAPSAAERYMTGGGIADLRRADDNLRRTRSPDAQAAERVLRAAGVTGIDEADDADLVAAARNLGR